MRIVIIGIGQTGKELAKELIKAEHEVIVIDTNKFEIEEFTNHYDAVGIVGNGATKNIQEKAKMKNADVLISLTSSDEVNLMSSITGKLLGAKYTIARIKEEDYIADEKYLTESLGIDMIINLEHDTAKEITRLISYPTNINVGAFANGKVDVAQIKVKENSMLTNLKITDLKETFKADVLVAGIIRNDKFIIPRGDAVIQDGDELYVTSRSTDIYKFLETLNLIDKPVRRVLMVGCGQVGKYLLSNLKNMKMKIKVIEFDAKRCMELAEEFPDIKIIHGNGIDSEILIDEGIEDYDSCISLTGNDETNLVVTLFASSFKIRKLITKIVSLNYTKMLNNVEIDNTISPHLVALNSIHRFIRGINESGNNNDDVKSLYRFAQNNAEAIEFEARESFSFIGKSLKEIKVNKNVLIALIIRDQEVIIPKGDTTIEVNDRVMVIAPTSKNISDLEDIL